MAIIVDFFSIISELKSTGILMMITLLLYVVLLPLNCLSKRFTKTWLKLLSWGCYLSLPVLISYTIGILAAQEFYLEGNIFFTTHVLFGYSSFDNLICFTLQERNNRTILFFQFTIQVVLFLLYSMFVLLKSDEPDKPPNTNPFWISLSEFGTEVILPSVLVLVVVCLKVMERIVALAHAAGATTRIRKDLRRIINYTNMDDHEDHTEPMTMEGFKILVGPRYSTIEDDKIFDGIRLEKIWGILSSTDSNGQLKDTRLSFSLFWLLLGKFHSYPLYKGRSKRKAWKLVRENLLADYERAFRVIEVELCFLHDYFYTKYFFFYLNGVWRKVIYLLAFVLIVHFSLYGQLFEAIILPLEVIQIAMFISSSWFRVILISYVAKSKESQKGNRLLTRFIETFVVAISRISLCAKLSKPWKRALDQYSLLESCTSFGMYDNNCVQAALGAGLGIPVRKPGRKLSSSVALSSDVKKAVILSLQSTGPRLSNGVASLRRNGVENELSWACKLGKDAEVVLVWHIATCLCEMRHSSDQQHTLVNFNVATNLSKYCAYLLAFSPSLLSIPEHEADLTLEYAIKDASKVLKKCSFLWFKKEKTNRYEKLMESLHGEEGSTRDTTYKVLQRGLKLGEQLLTMDGINEERRWKIVAELWAEMILFMAPSMKNLNAFVHAEKLADGGEFITLLWALLIHAGVVDRLDLIRSPYTDDDEAELVQSGYI